MTVKPPGANVSAAAGMRRLTFLTLRMPLIWSGDPLAAAEKCALVNGFGAGGFAAREKPAFSLIRSSSSLWSCGVRTEEHASRRSASWRHGVSLVADQSKISSTGPIFKILPPQQSLSFLYRQAD